VVLVGWASLGSAESTFFLARNGSASHVSGPAPRFTLIDQNAARYTLGEHVGHYTLLTFLDPKCWTDCPLLADQMKTVRAAFSPGAPIDMVAAAADRYHQARQPFHQGPGSELDEGFLLRD
jgi:cytochrome oxidase Cu insertion factor (SCO1/SenC/PrrC family)